MHNPAGDTYAHGTQEWARHTLNIQDGCYHDCRYCYAKALAIRFKRSTPTDWSHPRLRVKALDKSYRKRAGRIMFPSSHDITEDNLDACLSVLRNVVNRGNDVLIVTKPSLAVVKPLCRELHPYRSSVTFRITIGSASDTVLRFWEPNAPRYRQRLAALKHAAERGFQTSVSCEPMLDDRIEKVISDVRPYVTDSIWIGQANRLRQIIAMNCPDDPDANTKAEELLEFQDSSRIENLYLKYRSDRQIRWKDSIKKRLGLSRPVMHGLDV